MRHSKERIRKRNRFFESMFRIENGEIHNSVIIKSYIDIKLFVLIEAGRNSSSAFMHYLPLYNKKNRLFSGPL